ncbi:CRISPR-associated protein Cas5h [Malaciobacter marinus]|jgi:CRISPR-associated protein Cas5h|uniref:CRISPR-associated protein Cas5h n=1 Tax=Malaciobacter marinus TaxID=505249 RepID=A0AB36ZYI6_9BACT|nr:type I-B CRISPR-associated protein Cas5b [Malaciobacter marinus]PPK62449.1 CRISPR-associated protein Cas5h [Malaciobacter marinus]
MKKLISFTIKSDFGMFKKPDINDKIFITYNIIPKTYILGMLGAIMGYEGYAQNRDKTKMPEFYEKLKDIRVAIAPSDKNGGIFKKEFILFNNTTNGETKNITEQTLVNPAYDIFLELDETNQEYFELIMRLENKKAEFLPYMGKNEFSLWWNDFHEHTVFQKVEQNEQFQVLTIIPKGENFVLKNSGYKERTTNYFYLFERLPIDWSDNPRQYKYQDFLYTNAIFKSTESFESLKEIGELIESDKGIICLF